MTDTLPSDADLLEDPRVRPSTGAGLETERMREAIGERLFGSSSSKPISVGRFVILRRLGSGAMGSVYEAFDPVLDRRVALKVLHSKADGAHSTSRRTLREAKSLGRLTHPNVVAVYDAGIDDGRVFVAMELVVGHTLSEWCRIHPPGRQRTAQMIVWLEQACRGLIAAHSAGLVHRDLKPSNMLIGADGRLRIADFGLARPLGTAATPTPRASTPAEVSASTHTGDVAGTPAFMAPEQFAGVSDAAADQFSLCAAFWLACFDVHPFPVGDLQTRHQAIERGTPDPGPVAARVPKWLRRLLERGLAFDPRERHADIPTLLAALSKRVTKQRVNVALSVVIGGLGIAAGLAVSRHDASLEPPSCTSVATDEAQELHAAIESLTADTPGRRDEAVRQTLGRELGAVEQRWIDARTRACDVRTRGASTPDLVLEERCLARALAAARRVVDVLGDEELTEAHAARSVAFANTVASPEACTDLERLRAEPLPPEHPAIAAWVEALRGELAGFVLRKQLFADAPAVELWGEDLVRRCEATGYAPLIARANREFAGLFFANATLPTRALDALTRAVALASASGDDAVVILAVADLAEKLASDPATRPEAYRWLAVGEATVEHSQAARSVRWRGLQSAMMFSARGDLQTKDGAHDEAVASFAEADRRVQEFDPSADARAYAKMRLGGALISAGRLDEAAEVLRAADEALLAIPFADGGMQYQVLSFRTWLAQVGEDLQTGAALAPRLVAKAESYFGPDHEETCAAKSMHAAILLAMGRTAEARRINQDVLATLRQIEGLSPELLGYQVLNVLATAPAGVDVRPWVDEAMALQAAAHPDSVEFRAEVLRAVAEMDPRGRDGARSIELRRSIELYESAGAKTGLVYARTSLADVLRRQGRLGDAQAEAERARAEAIAVFGEHHSATASATVVLARTRMELGHREEATALLDAVLREPLATPYARATLAHAWLARAMNLQGIGEREAAARALDQALAIPLDLASEARLHAEIQAFAARSR